MTSLVPGLVVFVLDNEDHIEPGQDGGLKVNVLCVAPSVEPSTTRPEQNCSYLARTSSLIVSSPDWIRSGEHTGPGI
jgi:hypothetical protein